MPQHNLTNTPIHTPLRQGADSARQSADFNLI